MGMSAAGLAKTTGPFPFDDVDDLSGETYSVTGYNGAGAKYPFSREKKTVTGGEEVFDEKVGNLIRLQTPLTGIEKAESPAIIEILNMAIENNWDKGTLVEVIHPKSVTNATGIVHTFIVVEYLNSITVRKLSTSAQIVSVLPTVTDFYTYSASQSSDFISDVNLVSDQGTTTWRNVDDSGWVKLASPVGTTRIKVATATDLAALINGVLTHSPTKANLLALAADIGCVSGDILRYDLEYGSASIRADVRRNADDTNIDIDVDLTSPIRFDADALPDADDFGPNKSIHLYPLNGGAGVHWKTDDVAPYAWFEQGAISEGDIIVANPYQYGTAALLKATTNLNDGTKVSLQGYNSPGDAGETWELIYHETGRTGVTVDEGRYLAGSGADDYFESLDRSGNVVQFGGVGNGVADDTVPAQNALAHGRVFAPYGKVFRTTAPLVPNKPNCEIYGTGRRDQRTIDYTVLDDFGMFFSDHTGDFVLLSTPVNVSGFHAHDFSVQNAQKDNGAGRLGNAFHFRNTDATSFNRDYTIERVTIHGFENALYASATSSMEQHGVLKVLDCAIRFNKWIHNYDGGGTRWNQFIFDKNEAGQNGYDVLGGAGGIKIRGQGIVITNSLLEGQSVPVAIEGAGRGAIVKGNYFEANIGDYCISVESCLGPVDVFKNTFLSQTTVTNIVMLHCSNIVGDYPYTAKSIMNEKFPALHKMEKIADYDIAGGLLWAGKPEDNRHFTTAPDYINVDTNEGTVRAVNALDKRKWMGIEKYTTAGNGLISKTSTITGAIGEWLCASFMYKKDDTTIPLVALRSGGVALYQQSFHSHSRVQDGEWWLATVAVELEAAITDAEVYFYPHGVNPAAGLLSEYTPVNFYTVSDVSKVKPWMNVAGLTTDIYLADRDDLLTEANTAGERTIPVNVSQGIDLTNAAATSNTNFSLTTSTSMPGDRVVIRDQLGTLTATRTATIQLAMDGAGGQTFVMDQPRQRVEFEFQNSQFYWKLLSS